MKTGPVKIFFVFVFVLMLLGSKSGFAQQDSITYNSTCNNYKIVFGSSIFNKIDFPDKVLWNFGDPGSGIYNNAGSLSPSHLYSANGNYAVTLQVILGGDTTKIVDTIKVVSPIAFNFGPDIYMCGKGDTSITGPIVPGASFQWTDDSLTVGDTLRVSESGIYTVKVNGCAVTDSIGIFFSDKPQIDLGKDHILCSGEILSLNATSQNATYTWKLNGTVLPQTLGQIQVVEPGGQYIVSASVAGCGVYGDTVNITFASLAAPPFNLGPDTLLCPKQVYTLTANVAGASAYNWSTGATDSSIQITQAGTYWAFVTVKSTCEVVDSVDVTYRDDEQLAFHDTAICKGSTLVLVADFGTGTYNWVADPPQRNDQNQTGQSTYFVYEPGLYKVTASVGNCVYTDSLHVAFNDSLKLDIGRDTSLCIGEQYKLNVKTNANSFVWQDGSTASIYAVTDSGTYSVIAQNGCGADTAMVKVAFRPCECQLLLPNAFTPNGDGLNENFRPLHPCKISNYSLKIFNRYGQLVFASQDPSQGWNGFSGGIRAEAGNYVWVASYINTDTNQHKTSKGFVILIR